MPSYDYRCADCDHVFEEFQRITAEPGAKCPGCGSIECTRLISGGTFHLKGSGWYASDYGGSGRSGTASSRKDASASSTSSVTKSVSTDSATSGGAPDTAASKSASSAASPSSSSGTAASDAS